MGCGPSAPASWPVKVNVYTLGDHELNSALTSLFGSGAYHTGVEISGVEYAFRGGDGAGTGVFTHTPRQLPEGFEGAVFKESVDMGGTKMMAQSELRSIVKQVSKKWPAAQYDLLARNCNHFSTELCAQLGCPNPLPPWVNNLAGSAEAGITMAAGLLGMMAIGMGAALDAMAEEEALAQQQAAARGSGDDPVQIEELDINTGEPVPQ